MMRVIAAALLIVASALSVSVARSGQDAPPPEAVRRPRIVTELSELLTHSPLEKCRKADARTADAGKLSDCKVVDNSAAGKGFDKAAMCIAEKLPMGAKTGTVKVPFRFPGGA